MVNRDFNWKYRIGPIAGKMMVIINQNNPVNGALNLDFEISSIDQNHKMRAKDIYIMMSVFSMFLILVCQI